MQFYPIRLAPDKTLTDGSLSGFQPTNSSFKSMGTRIGVVAPLAGIAAIGHPSRGKKETWIDFRGLRKEFVGAKAGEMLALL